MNGIEYFIDWLDSYLNFEKQPEKNIFWLDTIDYLCSRFDYPQNCAPCFHVAGSKGKGSVSRMIACILEEAGYSTGLYTSPHITDFRERICRASSFFESSIYEDTVKELIPNIESIIPENLPAERPITWFELVTLYAFLVFRRAKVDWAVYEVGMGGRLDSTNIIRPKLCCITPIELEHTEFLGDTLEKIAAEKAGIIKNCTPVIISRQQTESVKIILREKACTRYAPCYFVDDLIKDLSVSFDKINKKMNIKLDSDVFDRPIQAKLSLLGKMQAENAAMAAFAVKKIFPNMNESVIERGLEKAVLPGRFEIINKVDGYENIQDVILDGAHTLNSIKLTLETLESLYSDKKINLLFACAADKDIKDISLQFRGRFNNIFVTKPGEIKKSDINSEIECFKSAGIDFTANPDYKAAIRDAFRVSSEQGNVLLVTGSFYLIAEVKKLLNI